MFVQLCNSFPEELKTTKQIIIYKNVTEDLSWEKKMIKLNIIKTKIKNDS